MAETLYLVDSNVLLRWVKPDHSDYPAIVSATDVILQRGGVLCYTSQNVAEFWNTCTRPLDRNGYGLSPQEADRRARFFEEKLRLLPDGLSVHEEWRKLLVSCNVSGAKVHDARLVAAMHVHGVTHVLTFNDKDFVRYTNIEVVHPRALPPK
ncbi:MAG: PIN domain-containing protein [Candidatus Acidiferrales bacterium]